MPVRHTVFSVINENWPTDAKSAKRLQEELRRNVKIEPLRKPIKYVAGADASYLEDRIIGVVAVFSYEEMKLIEEAYSVDRVRFPYIPGLLSFREGPVLLRTFSKLSIKPDLILFDGHGICHPRRLGIASHIGVLLDLPTIGVAKSPLLGTYKEPGSKKGEGSYIYVGEELAGLALRTKSHTKPLFISPGHLIDIEDSRKVVLECCKGYRIPEPLRRSHMTSRLLKSRLGK